MFDKTGTLTLERTKRNWWMEDCVEGVYGEDRIVGTSKKAAITAARAYAAQHTDVQWEILVVSRVPVVAP